MAMRDCRRATASEVNAVISVFIVMVNDDLSVFLGADYADFTDNLFTVKTLDSIDYTNNKSAPIRVIRA